MKYIVKYGFENGRGISWYTHSEHDNLFDAKQALKKLKKHVGTCGKTKIVKE